MAIKRIDYYGRFEPTPVDESAARRFQALAGLADTVRETAIGIGERALEKRAVKAEKAGIEAGGLAVGEAVKTGNLELRSGGTIYDESYNDALEAGYLAQVSTDAKNEFAKLIAQAPDDSTAFSKLAEKAIAGIKTGVDPRYVDVIDSTLNNYLANAETKVFAAEQAKNRRIANEARLEAIQSTSAKAASLSREGNRQDAMADVMEAEVTIDSMVATGDLSAQKAGELKRANRREVLEQDYKFQLDQKVEAEGFSAAFEELDKFERDKDFTPDEWAA